MAFYDYKGNDLTKKFITGKISYEDCERLMTRQMKEEIYKEVKEKLISENKRLGEFSYLKETESKRT